MNHQISHLAVIFAIIKFAVACVASRFAWPDQFTHQPLIDIASLQAKKDSLFLLQAVLARLDQAHQLFSCALTLICNSSPKNERCSCSSFCPKV